MTHTDPTDAELAAAIERGIAAGDLIELTPDVLAAMAADAEAERFWTVADGRAREVVLLAEEVLNVSYRVRAVDTGAEWVTFTGLHDTRAEALASNGL